MSQDELMADKLKDYLQRHPEIQNCLGTGRSYRFEVSSLNRHAQKWRRCCFPKSRSVGAAVPGISQKGTLFSPALAIADFFTYILISAMKN